MASLKNLLVAGTAKIIGAFTAKQITTSEDVTVGTTLTAGGRVTASGFKTTSGTSSQFLKADGSVDSNAYAKTSSVSGETITIY